MHALSRQILPWLKVILSQALALALMLSLGEMVLSLGPLRFLAEGVIAAAIGYGLRLKPFWIPAQVAIPIVAAYSSFVPAWLFLAAFVLFALIYWNSASEQVPLYLTNRRTSDALAELARANNCRSFVDLGSGLGGVVLQMARSNESLIATGVETAPLVFAAAWIKALFAGLPNARFRYRSIWDENLSGHDLVYCFLSPAPMPRMYEKARAEMRPGTLLVSNSFAIPNREPDQIIAVTDGRQTKLFLYRM
ncbi:class I SAM-dependent methyltransferase [Rhizobium alvei]|uniref:Trans-aconitate methyltransferase n=1 Tax=Rhizobium alvei TaxID=1132659 RepID=A0ABT8YJ29_9HYPH|nr:hypothetical protein [Rhizobium alvei]MDO6963703.1 hypothetical protein [Rhizobium alvei]